MLNNMNLFGEEKKSNLKIIYHGSSNIVKNPTFGIGKSDNDYGSGFYTTEEYDKAASWALLTGNSEAFINIYEINLENLNIIYLNDFGVLAWLAEIIKNRGVFEDDILSSISYELCEKYEVNTNYADIIIGYRADDSYMEVVESFLNGLLSIDEIKRLFYKGNLGNQLFIKSKKAFDRLNFIKANKIQFTDEYIEKDIIARKSAQIFLNNRRIQVAKGFKVPSINIGDVLKYGYKYNKEYDFYERI